MHPSDTGSCIALVLPWRLLACHIKCTLAEQQSTVGFAASSPLQRSQGRMQATPTTIEQPVRAQAGIQLLVPSQPPSHSSSVSRAMCRQSVHHVRRAHMQYMQILYKWLLILACSPLQPVQGFVQLRCQLHHVGAPQRLKVTLKHLPLLGQPLQGWGKVGARGVKGGRQGGRDVK